MTLTSSGAAAGTQYYVVNPDGSFLISESADMTDPVHPSPRCIVRLTPRADGA